MNRLAARLLLDLRGVKERGDDRSRADADRDARLDELLPPLLAGFVLPALVGHVGSLNAYGSRTSMSASQTMEALR